MSKDGMFDAPKQSLEEIDKSYRDLFDNTSDLIMIHNLEGQLLNVNPAVSRLSGYTYEELIGRPIHDFIIPKFRSSFREEYLKEINQKGYAEGVVIFQTKDGREHYVEYSNVLVKQEGREPYVRGLERNITDRRKAEMALQKAYDELKQRVMTSTIDTHRNNIRKKLGIQNKDINLFTYISSLT
jgi:hypothetical protein